MKCDNCGAEIGLDGVCKFCGTVLPPREPVAPPPVAPGWGTPPPRPVFSIPQPRVPVQQPVQAASPKSRWVAILLWLLLGYLGAHQFYAGKVGMGILYLFTFGLCGIGWVIDGVSLFAGSFRDRYGLPIRV
ncbi:MULTISPECIES: TM2 domain-containing protein [Eubacteriales]|uniref:TM2 domain-containing protein n=1 Tax=Eubacteriales TaxID=186802 RepID=UPI001FCBAD31|nr:MULTISPECIES: TM2 domain-containing protein [Eubacteriales]